MMKVVYSCLVTLACLASIPGSVGAFSPPERGAVSNKEEVDEVALSVHDIGEGDFMDRMAEAQVEDELREIGEVGQAARKLAIECGADGSSCCSGDTLYGEGYCYDQNYRACNRAGICETCGADNESCCPTESGPTCDSEKSYCAPDNVCRECGDRNEPCCPLADGGHACWDSAYRTCNPDTLICENCGGEGELCCSGPATRKCDSALSFCDADNRCISCGGNEEPCCPNPWTGATGPNEGRCDDDLLRVCLDDGQENGVCKNCGGLDEPCCQARGGGTSCDSALLHCNPTNMQCESCGGGDDQVDEPCCPDPFDANTSTAPGSGTCENLNYRVCHDDGTGVGKCVQCGDQGQPCCNHPIFGETCDSAFETCIDHMCEACGLYGQPCCDGDKCNNEGFRTCNVVTGKCENCGGNGELACVGLGIKPCDSEFSIVDTNGLCQPCGNSGQDCCENMSNRCKNSNERICVAKVFGTLKCESCGWENQPCCATLAGTKVCHSDWLMCDENGVALCERCGGPGEQCCPGPDKCQNSDHGCEPSTGTCMDWDLHPSKVKTSCPPVGSQASVQPSVLTIPKSRSGVLCTITLVNGHTRIPVVRSYDENEWEQYSGAYSEMAVLCDLTTCTFELGQPAEGWDYMLESFPGHSLSNMDLAARFLETATFGMKKADISGLAALIGTSGDESIATWIADQMDETVTPVTSHREFYRERTNGIFESSSYLGEVTRPCEINTTYRRYAFTSQDFRLDVVITSLAGTSKKKLAILGTVVTLVDGDVTNQNNDVVFSDGSYEVCSAAKNYVGGLLRLRHPTSGCIDVCFNNGACGNPPVDLEGLEALDPAVSIKMVTLTSGQARPIDQQLYKGNETQMLTLTGPLDDALCGSLPDGPGPIPAVFARYENQWFTHTPRIKLMENSLSAPLADGGGSIVTATTGSEEIFQARCANVARTFSNEESCQLSNGPSVCTDREFFASPKLVCGSPGEIPNNLTLGGTQFFGGFTAITNHNSSPFLYQKQKHMVWTAVVLSAPDQLRQRMAWALSQIIVVNRMTVGDSWTEEHLNFYDIFVKNAFGNYRQILKEVSYSGMMAYFLSYHDSKSTEYHWTTSETHRHPDENYAREVMQLFSVGMYMLNEDGTQKKGDSGESLRVYTNDDILEYSRVWTGFKVQNRRGNIENVAQWANRIDPMQIIPEYRDSFPKMGLQGKYIGDGYPLCADLPTKHFMVKGARYRLLGNTSYPELQEEQEYEGWDSDPSAVRPKADPNGALFSLLCNGSPGSCSYQAVVILPNTVSCSGAECDVDTVRTIEVEDGIFYEYIRPACVNLAFYPDAKKIKMRNGGTRTYMCADPRTEEAGSICCRSSDQRAYRYEKYWAERVLFSTAQNRCDVVPDRGMCLSGAWLSDCSGISCWGNTYYWTSKNCEVKIKINDEHKIAIVHSDPDETTTSVTRHVAGDSKTFFRVHWNDREDVGRLLDQCGTDNLPCSVTTEGDCLCHVSASEEQAFSSTPTRQDVLSLSIGAFEPDPSVLKTDLGNGVWVYGPFPYTQDTVFEVRDYANKKQLRKNMKSKVILAGITPALEFRTPVHMISLAEKNERDAEFETEAALDHYFYHPNLAPFLAYRLAQRLVTSNPTPRFVASIATAFRTGYFTFGGNTFGSGQYGDLGAALAALLLDAEARNSILDSDVFHGSFREPLLKLIQLMGTLEYQPSERAPLTEFRDLEDFFGQMVFEAPDVFSFFHPDFVPDGVIAKSSLVSPEAGVLNTPEIVSTMNGLMSFVKYGFVSCYDSLGYTLDGESSSCNSKVPGDYTGSSGHLSFIPDENLSPMEVVDELATLMTSGRLSDFSRQLIAQEYAVEKIETGHKRATIKAQQLILATPEFHASGRVSSNGQSRPTTTLPAPTTNDYRAVVFLMMEGGCDSFNMIVPHSCSVTNSKLVEQYVDQRGTLALSPLERGVKVIGVSGQPCEQFSLHPELHTIEYLYNQGDLAFFMNTGVLNAPTNKENYNDVTKTQLFAHNAMQQEAKRGDPFGVKLRTGYLGRLADVLLKHGYQPNAISIDVSSEAVQGETEVTISPTIVNREGVKEFHPRPVSEDDIKWDVLNLNKGLDLGNSSMFGETWSMRLSHALWEIDILDELLSSVSLSMSMQLPDEPLAKRFQMIAKLMLTRQSRGSDRDVFYATIGGFDTHDDMKERLTDRFIELDGSFGWFQQELKDQGLWENVTIVAVSDFGRTITPNSGEGSDHAWGGNYWLAGGGVKGGQALCKYPSEITPESPLNVGKERVRFIPECSWESIWHGVTQWMFDGNLSDADRDEILPNALNTGAILYNMSDLYK